MVKMAFHQLVVRVEKALDQQALGVFLDIEGAFNNTCYDTMCDGLVRHGSKYTIVRWIRATLEGRVAVTTLDGLSVGLTISRDCPQGGVLSPLLCCPVVDDLLARLSGSGVFILGYTDDIWLLVVVKFPNTVSAFGATRSDCQSILIRLDSLYLPGQGNSRGSLNHTFLGLD
jgi:hypothetical protein